MSILAQTWEESFNNWEYAPLLGWILGVAMGGLLIFAGIRAIKTRVARDRVTFSGRKAVVIGWYYIAVGVALIIGMAVMGICKFINWDFPPTPD